MNRRSKAILLSGLIVIAATIFITLLCINEWSDLKKYAFSAIIWSEIVFFGGFIFVEWASKRTEQIIIRSGLYTLISAYAAINIIFSIIFSIITIAFFDKAVTLFMVVEAILFSIAAVVSIILFVLSRSLYRLNEQTMKSVENVESMAERLNKLSENPNYERFSDTLKKLSQDLRFTDVSVNCLKDDEINNIISDIEFENLDEKSDEKIEDFLIRLKSLINQRKVFIETSKKGRI